MAKVFNLGIGMVVVVARGGRPASASTCCAPQGHRAAVVGRVVAGHGETRSV